MTTAAMAPEPCSARPRMMPQMESLSAAMTLPITKINRPLTISGLHLRPIRSESRPEGIWNTACARP